MCPELEGPGLEHTQKAVFPAQAWSTPVDGLPKVKRGVCSQGDTANFHP